MDIFWIKKRYILESIEKFNIKSEYPIRNMNPIGNKNLRGIKCNKTLYRSVIGNLLYLAICTRPDIVFPISKAAWKSNNPNMEDWKNILRIIRYLKGTISYGLNYTRKWDIEAYVDSDFGVDEKTRRSTTISLV